jgi:PEP-CTERM motif
VRNISSTVSRIFAALLLTTCVIGTPVRAAPITAYEVLINTTAINGLAGFIDLQFNPGSAAAPFATASLSNVIAPTLDGAPVRDGNAFGGLANASFDNGTAFNALLQGVQSFTNSFSFHIDFGGAFLSALGGDGTTFSLGLVDANFAPYLGTNPSILTFELSPGAITPTAFDAAVQITAINAVPEPQTYALMLMGLSLLGIAARRKRKLQN